MITDELKQEAEEKCVCTDEAMRIMYRIGYIDGAEPREKQIQIDAKQIRALQKQKGELTDKVRELETQIEKMKCCENCKHHRFCGDVLECKIIDCNNLESWELTFGVSN